MFRLSILFVFIAAPLAAEVPVGVAPGAGPVAYWSFDVDFTATLGDPVYDGVAVNGVAIDSAMSRFGGGSARFDKAAGQSVRVDAAPFSEGSYSYAAWYYLDVEEIRGIGDAHRYYVLETGPVWSASYGVRYDAEFAGGPSNGSVVTALTHDNGTSGFMPHLSFPSPSHREWRHVAVTYDADWLTLETYIDGVSIGTVRLRPSASRISPSERLTIGGHRDGGRNWEGWIDDVAVWDRVLSAEEIAFLQTNPVSAWEPPERQVFAVYLAPDGDDQNSGLAPESAILSLGRANSIVRDADPQMDVEVRIAPGTYRGQRVSWRRTHPEFRTTFTPYPYDAERPVFDGCVDDNDCPGRTWFRISIFNDGTFSGTEPTNLEFLNLEIKNYETAIALDGDRHNPDTGFSAGNLVYGCRFFRIGNVFNPDRPRSTAAIRLINSKDNIFKNNDFEMIANADPGDFTSLHAIYVTHHSERNAIVQNRFIDNTGDAVRIRDASHETVVLDNVFVRAGKYGYSDWYCDSDARDDCTKLFPECPSWGGRFHENVLDTRWDNGVLGVSVMYQPDASADCEAIADSRVGTTHNVYATPSESFLEEHRQLSRFERGATDDTREPLVYFDLWHIPTAWEPTAPATDVVDGLSAAPLSRGPGINASNMLRGFSANGWDRASPSRETALANGDYFEFAVTVEPGYTASFSALDHHLRRSGVNSAMNIEWQYSFDGFATAGQPIPTLGSVWQTLGRVRNVFAYLGRASGSGCVPDGYNYMQMDVCDQNQGNRIPRFELGGNPDFQEIPGGSTVTFRMYAWGNDETAASNSLAFGREVGPMLLGTVQREAVAADFTDWREDHFPGQAADESVSGPGADPSGNGIRNLASFFLGLDPWHPHRERLPVAGVREIDIGGVLNRYLTLELTRRADVFRLDHRVLAGGDLRAHPFAGEAELHEYQENSDGTVTEIWRDTQPVSEVPRRFLKLVIEPY